jgi:hypothetical protein
MCTAIVLAVAVNARRAINPARNARILNRRYLVCFRRRNRTALKNSREQKPSLRKVEVSFSGFDKTGSTGGASTLRRLFAAIVAASEGA